MSILIKGTEMPTERESFNLTIKYNGTVLDTETGLQVAEAHELPPHGRLIDADALKAEFPEPNEANGGWRNPDEAIVHKTGVWACIDCAPTIIPAEEVYGQYTDTAGNFHWFGTHSGEHTVKAEEGE